MSDVEKKAAHIKLKTDEARLAFNLPETEPVIQDYSSVWNHKTGRIYLTPNYFLFSPSIGSSGLLQLPFRKFKGIRKEKNVLVFDNSLTIESDDGQTYFFSSFTHRDETYNLIEYLWKNPVTYTELNDDFTSFSRKSVPVSKSLNGEFSNNPVNHGENENRNYRYSDNVSQQVQTTMKLDTQSTKNALRIASQARDMGTSTLTELTLQAEQLDRIENNVEQIHSNLDRSNRILRGIESFGGAISNSVTKDTTSNFVPGQFKDRTLEIKKDIPPLDFNILEKLNNDHLQPAIMRFTIDRLIILDSEKKSDPQKNMEF
jgi:hypothetical protein